jgi:hypothetical protein
LQRGLESRKVAVFTVRALSMIAKEDRNRVALARFLATNPDLQEEIQELSEKEQQQQAQWAFEDAAQEQGIEPWELTLELVAESPQELKALRLEVHKEVAEALGMPFQDYCTLNEIKL